MGSRGIHSVCLTRLMIFTVRLSWPLLMITALTGRSFFVSLSSNIGMISARMAGSIVTGLLSKNLAHLPMLQKV